MLSPLIARPSLIVLNYSARENWEVKKCFKHGNGGSNMLRVKLEIKCFNQKWLHPLVEI
jgi:hypothetical protein